MKFIDLLKGTAAYLTQKAKDAAEWYRNRILNIGRQDNPNEIDNTFKKKAVVNIGRMYIYYYDPKWKHKLPFWDTYPLVIPIEFYDDGFLGLNLHYLPPLARAQLLQALIDLVNNTDYDHTTRLNISYRILKTAASRFPSYETCVKRYLYGHVRSSFHEINPSDWSRVVMLPLQRWSINPNKGIASKSRPPY